MIDPIAGALSRASMVVVAAAELDLQRLVARLERRYGTDYDVIGVRSAADAIARLSNLRDTGREVAIVLADHRLRDISGIALLARLQPLHSGAKRGLLVSAADAWGADPVATKDFVRVAGTSISGAYTRRLLSAYGAGAPHPAVSAPAAVGGLAETLTARETEILGLVAAGMRNQEIADQLVISLSTVKRHIANAYGKLGVTHRTEAVARLTR